MVPIGSTSIPATISACCAGNDDVNRQVGGAILSRFRIIFNYPAATSFSKSIPKNNEQLTGHAVIS